MPFTASDTYCGSGGVQLFDSWTPTVNKFDTSTFYNWEQDNLPIYDLEDRTDLLWEKLGFSTSCLDSVGVSLVVSRTSPGSPPDHENTYSSLDFAIDALPEVIRYPITIEVDASGELGSLKLNGLQFDKNGCLEIINRRFGRVFADTELVGGAGAVKSVNSGYIVQVSSMDLSNTILDTSVVSTGTPTYVEAEWENFNRTVIQVPEFAGNGNPNTKKLTFSYDSPIHTSTANKFQFNPYELVAATDPTLSYDFNEANSGFTGASISRADPVTDNKVQGMAYGNALSSVEVINCGGPIYIRGFIVDGVSGTATATFEHITEAGFDITNSQVVIENCASVRNRNFGLRAINSNVILNRGFVSYRNYNIDVGTNIRNTNTESAGLKAYDSTITLSSTGDAINSDLDSDLQFGYGRDAFFSFSRNAKGISLVNSTLTGGRTRSYNSDLTWAGDIETGLFNTKVNYLQAFQNTEVGLELVNSYINTTARLSVFSNKDGIRADNSILYITEHLIEMNEKIGMKLLNSTCLNNPNLTPITGRSSVLGSQFEFNKNGQHIVAKNSTLLPAKGVESKMNFGPVSSFSFMEGIHGRETFSESHGISNNIALPGVELEECTAEFLHSRWVTDSSDFTTSAAVFGSLLSAKGSTVQFDGTVSGSTVILGASSLDSDGKVAGIYGSAGTIIKFSGPTVIGQLPIDVLVEDSSVVEFSPQKSTSIWNLDSSSNHTMVELHSTRACLVANNNSTINMRNLGDYHSKWGSNIQLILVHDGVSTDIADFNAQDSMGLELTTSGGHMQFYPNPQSPQSSEFTNPVVTDSTHNLGSLADAFDVKYLVDPIAGTVGDHQAISLGGVCVRACNNSTVNVQNVHFPTGWENASGVIYDFSGACSKLYIWNIADESQLKASYVSVSGDFPTSSVYHGPYSVYGEATAFSGAPSSTNETGSLSVLDTFGLSSSVASQPNGVYGKSTFDNRGPFRIYVSPKGPAKFLGYVSGTSVIHGAPYQQLAQGYNPSGDCSSTVSGIDWHDTGSIYRSLFPALKEPDGILSEASSFFYTSSMIAPGYENRILLDDSAMNLFANAKNGTTGTSGRSKIVTYVRNLQIPQGNSWDADQAGYGLGFLSATTFDLERKN